MSSGNYDAVVVGVGAMGSAALFHLSQRGCRACGIEQFEIAHDRGSSHGDTRIIRKAYPEKSEYAPLLERSYTLWQGLEAESGETIFHPCGFLAISPGESDYFRRIEAYYRAHPLPHQRWGSDDLRHHFPQFRLPEHYAAFFDPQGGILWVERAIRAHVAAATALGAEIFTGETVRSWKSSGGGVIVETHRRTVRARRLVITTGAWVVPELARLGLRLEIWRRVNLWFPAVHPDSFSPEKFPAFVVDRGGTGFYGCPAVSADGVKIGEHNRPQIIATPAGKDRPLLRTETAPIQDFARRFLPDLLPAPGRRSTCLYTLTPDHHPIIDCHPEHPNVLVACGFSGHGFKFAPLVGEILSELALDGQTRHPAGFLKINRFLN